MIIGIRVLLLTLGMIGLMQNAGIFSRRYTFRNLVRYYTSLSNLIVLGYLLLSFFSDAIPDHLWQIMSFSSVMSILLTFLVYHGLLSSMDRQQAREEGRPGIFWNYGNLVLHYVIPVLTMIYYMIFEPRGLLRVEDGVFWTIIPLLYLVGILGLAHVNRKRNGEAFYPYPFLDVKELGGRKVLQNCALLIAVFLAMGILICWLFTLGV